MRGQGGDGGVVAHLRCAIGCGGGVVRVRGRSVTWGRRERESEARWKRAIFSNPTHAERQRRVRGVWRMSMPMRFEDALLRE